MSRGILSWGDIVRGDIVRVDFVLGGYCPGGYCPRTSTEHMAHVSKFYTLAQTFIFGIITASAKHFLYLLVIIHVSTWCHNLLSIWHVHLFIYVAS